MGELATVGSLEQHMSSLTTITLLPKPTTPKPAEAPSSPDKRVQFAWQVKGLTKASFHMKAATALRTAIADLSFIALDTVFVDQVTDEKEERAKLCMGTLGITLPQVIFSRIARQMVEF